MNDIKIDELIQAVQELSANVKEIAERLDDVMEDGLPISNKPGTKKFDDDFIEPFIIWRWE